MTHKDIYTKFMIEYDKANVTSSYPSYTEYEVATILDKAYIALVGQKYTGNNYRRVGFEQDIKNIEDLRPLIITTQYNLGTSASENLPHPLTIANVKHAELYGQDDKHDHLYFVSGQVTGGGYNNAQLRMVPHSVAQKFFETDYNKPWIKQPVCFMESNALYVVYDPSKYVANPTTADTVKVTYVKKPHTFVKNFDYISADTNAPKAVLGMFDYSITGEQIQTYDVDIDKLEPYYTFELSDSMAEELINLAIAFALENTESTRLNTKLNMKGLEA